MFTPYDISSWFGRPEEQDENENKNKKKENDAGMLQNNKNNTTYAYAEVKTPQKRKTPLSRTSPLKNVTNTKSPQKKILNSGKHSNKNSPNNKSRDASSSLSPLTHGSPTRTSPSPVRFQPFHHNISPKIQRLRHTRGRGISNVNKEKMNQYKSLVLQHCALATTTAMTTQTVTSSTITTIATTTTAASLALETVNESMIRNEGFLSPEKLKYPIPQMARNIEIVNQLDDNGKAALLNRALKDINNPKSLEMLRSIGVSFGFVNNEMRYLAYSAILNVSKQKGKESSIFQPVVHKDWDQVVLDCKRSLTQFEEMGSVNSYVRIELRKRLAELIHRCLIENQNLSYYQGYGDICSILLLISGNEDPYLMIRQLSVQYLQYPTS